VLVHGLETTGKGNVGTASAVSEERRVPGQGTKAGARTSRPNAREKGVKLTSNPSDRSDETISSESKTQKIKKK